MYLFNRATPLVVALSLGLAGCGGSDSTVDNKPFEGEMPTAGAAEFSVGIPMT